ncbi:MAG: cyclodeaminase/cyclohydrolase family protein [Negativicutes bacterium]|nr:cyclodeaminase/cyclohydrolase family protein [Negativicutes bacterium]
MRLIEYQVKDFVELLASDAPAPGGGSTAALLGSLGAALTVMVANLTTGREKFKDSEPLVQELLGASRELSRELLVLIDRDTEAFNKVMAALNMPKTTEDEKRRRATALQAGLRFATEVPFAIMEKSAAALALVAKAVNKTNPSAMSDLGVGAGCLLGAVQGGWLNVLINLGGIKDEAFVASYKERGKRIVSESREVAGRLEKEIEAALT